MLALATPKLLVLLQRKGEVRGEVVMGQLTRVMVGCRSRRERAMELRPLPPRRRVYEDRGADPLLELQRDEESGFPPRNEGVDSEI